MVQHLHLVLRSPAEQLLEVELDEAVRIGALKKLGALQTALSHLAHEFAHAQIAALEQRLRPFKPFAGHHILIAEHLQVDGADQRLLVVLGGVQPVFAGALIGETLDAQIGSVGESHGAWGELAGGLADQGEAGAAPGRLSVSRNRATETLPDRCHDRGNLRDRCQGRILWGLFAFHWPSPGGFHNRYKQRRWRSAT